MHYQVFYDGNKQYNIRQKVAINISAFEFVCVWHEHFYCKNHNFLFPNVWIFDNGVFQFKLLYICVSIDFFCILYTMNKYQTICKYGYTHPFFICLVGVEY